MSRNRSLSPAKTAPASTTASVPRSCAASVIAAARSGSTCEVSRNCASVSGGSDSTPADLPVQP